MIMADVFKFLFLIAGTLIVFVSYWLAAAAGALSRRGHARETRSTTRTQFRITLLGVAIGVPVIVAGIAMVSAAPTPLLSLCGMIAAVPVVLGFLGSAGLSERIGVGLPSLGDEHQPRRRVLRGGVVLSLTFLLPVIGWFVVLHGPSSADSARR